MLHVENLSVPNILIWGGWVEMHWALHLYISTERIAMAGLILQINMSTFSVKPLRTKSFISIYFVHLRGRQFLILITLYF